MKLIVNDKPEILLIGNRLLDLLHKTNLTKQKGLAVAVNNNIVPKAEWENHELKENDKITIIRATQGG